MNLHCQHCNRLIPAWRFVTVPPRYCCHACQIKANTERKRQRHIQRRAARPPDFQFKRTPRLHPNSAAMATAAAIDSLSQLAAARPHRRGYCAHCAIIRLSQADRDDTCIFCREDLQETSDDRRQTEDRKLKTSNGGGKTKTARAPTDGSP